MTNALFDPGREGFLAGEIDWDTAVIKALLVRSYTFNAAHKFVSDMTGAGGAIHYTFAALSGKSVTSGVADASDITPETVSANASSHVLVLIQSSAVGGGSDVAASAQRLIAYLDSGTLVPITPNGGDIGVTWDNGSNKIFKL